MLQFARHLDQAARLDRVDHHLIDHRAIGLAAQLALDDQRVGRRGADPAALGFRQQGIEALGQHLGHGLGTRRIGQNIGIEGSQDGALLHRIAAADTPRER